MDALAAELLSFRPAADPDAPKAGKGGAGGGGMEQEEGQAAAGMGIPFVRIDGSHDSGQVWARVCMRV